MTSLKIVKGRELAQGVVAEVVLPERFGRFSIGRDPVNHWAIPDRSLAISGRHCEIVATPAGPALRDVSTNGTFVNGSQARLSGDHVLRDGDRFELGPYLVMVHVPVGDAAAPAGAIDAARAAARDGAAQARVAHERPVRGGDPAAMLAAGGQRPSSGLTEILRNLPPVDTEVTSPDQIVTKIRAAPKPGAPSAPAAAARAAAALPSFVPTTSPSPLAPSPLASSRGEWLRPLAASLGLAANAFDGRDPAEVLTQVGLLTRASVGLLRELLDAAAGQQVLIGGLMPPRSTTSEVDPLRLAATPEAALRALLSPGADVHGALQRAATTLRS